MRIPARASLAYALSYSPLSFSPQTSGMGRTKS